MAQQLDWGEPPWNIDFRSNSRDLPDTADFVVVGGGFSGLSAVAWLGRLAPGKRTVLLEAERIGAGASGRTGGMALAETAAGDLPGLGDVLAGYAEIIKELDIECDFSLTGAWEIGRNDGRKESPIAWKDSGELRVVNDVPGGTIDPGKMVSGLARAADQAGVQIAERTPVEELASRDRVVLKVRGRELRTDCVLLATNAEALELSELGGAAEPSLTMAVATEPLTDSKIDALGLSSGKPFYTVDFPYLWGRRTRTNSVVFGSGLVEVDDWHDLLRISIHKGQAAERIAWLEKRVHGLHPALGNVKITHRWGGPILFTDGMKPIFRRRRGTERVLVLAGYNGHGVALSVYLGKWAAEAMLGRRALPKWDIVG